jgi:hypothetical protein
MANKTWFLTPDFTFFPDGDIRLGTILKYPDRPTLSLATLGSDETTKAIVLPEIKTITEPGHAHSTGSGRSTSANVFAKFLDLASASGSVDVSRYKNRSFGTVDHEVRLFSGAPPPKTLSAIVQLDAVKQYINGGPFGRFKKRPVYMITGIRVAKDAFSVTDTADSSSSVAGEVSASAELLGAPLPLETGVGASKTREQNESHSYNTAPGIIFAYRMHVIRSKSGDGAESELFSDSTAFFTGEGDDDDDDDEQPMEFVDVTSDVVEGEKGVKSTVERHMIDDEEMVLFKGK